MVLVGNVRPCSFGSFVETDFGTVFRRHLVVGAFGVEATSTVGRRGFDTKSTLYSSRLDPARSKHETVDSAQTAPL